MMEMEDFALLIFVFPNVAAWYREHATLRSPNDLACEVAKRHLMPLTPPQLGGGASPPSIEGIRGAQESNRWTECPGAVSRHRGSSPGRHSRPVQRGELCLSGVGVVSRVSGPPGCGGRLKLFGRETCVSFSASGSML